MIENMLSPRGRLIFFIISFPMLAYVLWHRFAETGVTAWMDGVQATHWNGRYSPKLSVLILGIPIIGFSAAVGFLHDFVFRVGIYSAQNRVKQSKRGDLS